MPFGGVSTCGDGLAFSDTLARSLSDGVAPVSESTGAARLVASLLFANTREGDVGPGCVSGIDTSFALFGDARSAFAPGGRPTSDAKTSKIVCHHCRQLFIAVSPMVVCVAIAYFQCPRLKRANTRRLPKYPQSSTASKCSFRNGFEQIECSGHLSVVTIRKSVGFGARP